uniref:Uncharacterized protein n=1 Tax=Anguilla anguilla TaxID=7936 RepID=A0A0E9XPD0_ANGAN
MLTLTREGSLCNTLMFKIRIFVKP